MTKKNILKFNLYPLQKIIFSFIILILIGALLLLMPFSTVSGISFIDALFTSTSAVCVTGLIVLDTAKDFTLTGRILILILIQLGGFGIMTFSLGLISMLGGKLSLKWRYTFEGIYSEIGKFPVRSLLIRVIKYTLMIEVITAAILFTQFKNQFSIGRAIEHSVFHAISAFCNAGFSTFSNNLMAYKDNYIILTVISIAIILGGIGFIVLSEFSKVKIKNIRGIISQLSMHTKLTLITTLFLIVSGMIIFLFLEWNFAFKNMNISQTLMNSFFQSITCRTAGFNTIEISSLRESTHFIMMILMFIGGSPGSIAGGIKTTTIAVVVLVIYSKFKGRNSVTIWGRTLDRDIIDRSTTLIILSVMFISFIIFLMLTIRDFDIGHSFISVAFETTSAFGTTGLSMGITKQLPAMEKIILSIVMLTGRLGPLTLIMALTLKKQKSNVEYPREHIMIG